MRILANQDQALSSTAGKKAASASPTPKKLFVAEGAEGGD